MRCPSCGGNHKKSAGMRCGCGYNFVFNPAADGMTDGQFDSAIQGASAKGTYFFTFNQFYATLCRRLRAKQRRYKIAFAVGLSIVAGGVAMLLAAFAGSVEWTLPPGIVVTFVGVVVSAAAASLMFKRMPTVERTKQYVARWQNAGNAIDGLITERSLTQPPPPGPEADLYDYGAERLLIVERDMLVDWLVLNNFHAQERAVVISQKGYPEYLRDRVIAMLEANPQMKVFLLHDATRVGEDMHGAITQGHHNLSAMLKHHEIVDLGVGQADVKRLGVLKLFRKQAGGIPADFVPYGMLSAGMGMAMLHGIALASLPPQGDDGSSSTGYG